LKKQKKKNNETILLRMNELNQLIDGGHATLREAAFDAREKKPWDGEFQTVTGVTPHFGSGGGKCDMSVV